MDLYQWRLCNNKGSKVASARSASLATLKVAGLFYGYPMLPLSLFSDAYGVHRRAAARAQEVVRRYGIDVAEVLAVRAYPLESFDREWVAQCLALGPITCGEAQGPIIDYGNVVLPDSLGDFDEDYAEYYGD